MKRSLNSIVIALSVFAFAAGIVAQTSSKRKKVPLYSVPAGQTIHVRINQELKSEKAHIGDLFTSTLVDPVYSKNGVLLAPEGSIVTGKVTNVQRAQKNGKPAMMDVQFISLKLPNGRIAHINGSLTDLESSQGSKSNDEGTITAKENESPQSEIHRWWSCGWRGHRCHCRWRQRSRDWRRHWCFSRRDYRPG